MTLFEPDPKGNQSWGWADSEMHRENQLSWQVELGEAALMPTPAWIQTPLSRKNKDSSSDKDSVTWAHLMLFHEMEMFRYK